MAFRNTHRVGDWLMLDDESGAVHYASEMRQIWNGTWRHKDNFETRQPQEFIHAGDDPRALRHIRPEPAFVSAVSVIPFLVGETNVRTPVNGPAQNIFTVARIDDPSGAGGQEGIGTMEIGATAAANPFVVR
jgi:hypothetical protein